MNEKSSFEVLKLGEAEIGRDCGVSALFAEYAEADVSFLYHGDVVSSVADSCCHWPIAALFHHVHDLGFLRGRHSAAQDRVAAHGNVLKCSNQILVAL